MTPQSPDQLGICSWSTHPKDPADLIARVKELGLNKVQLALNPLDSDPDTWGSVKEQLDTEGITIVSGMFGTTGEDYSTLESIRRTGGVVPDGTWDANWAMIQRVAQLGADLKLRLISTHAGFLPDDPGDPSFRKLVDRIAQIANLLHRHDITLLFETGQETADTLIRFLGALDAKGARNTGVNFDPANMILYAKGDPIESLRKLMPRVRQVHIKDAVRTQTPGTWGSEVPIGEGEVDWEAFIRVLAEHDFRGPMVVEREAGEDRVGDVRKALDRLSQTMQEVR